MKDDSDMTSMLGDEEREEKKSRERERKKERRYPLLIWFEIENASKREGDIPCDEWFESQGGIIQSFLTRGLPVVLPFIDADTSTYCKVMEDIWDEMADMAHVSME